MYTLGMIGPWQIIFLLILLFIGGGITAIIILAVQNAKKKAQIQMMQQEIDRLNGVINELASDRVG